MKGADGQPLPKESAQARLERLQRKPPTQPKFGNDPHFAQRQKAWEDAVRRAQEDAQRERQETKE